LPAGFLCREHSGFIDQDGSSADAPKTRPNPPGLTNPGGS
jgi:hypothetical protein